MYVCMKFSMTHLFIPTSCLCEYECPSFERDILHLNLHSFINLIHIRLAPGASGKDNVSSIQANIVIVFLSYTCLKKISMNNTFPKS